MAIATISSALHGRDDQATLLLYATADGSWQLGETTAKRSIEFVRPIYAAFLGTTDVAKSLASEARSGGQLIVSNPGHKEAYGQHRVDFPRSASWRWREDDIGDGCTIVEVVLRDLIDPPIDSDRCQFLLASPASWSRGDRAKVASLLATQLDLRISAPVIADPRCWRYLLDSCLEQEWCHQSSGTREVRGPLYCYQDPSRIYDEFALIDAPVSDIDEWVIESTRAYVRISRKAGVGREPISATAAQAPRAAESGSLNEIEVDAVIVPAVIPVAVDQPAARQRRLPFSFGGIG